MQFTTDYEVDFENRDPHFQKTAIPNLEKGVLLI